TRRDTAAPGRSAGARRHRRGQNPGTEGFVVRPRLVFVALLLAAVALAAPAPRPLARVWPVTTVLAAVQQPESTKPQETPEAKENAGDEHEAAGGWKATIAKAVNFAILVAVLVYFLRTPLMAYLTGRIAKVR